MHNRIVIGSLIGVLAFALVVGCQKDKTGDAGGPEGQAGRGLTLEQPDDVSISRGGTAKVEITIRREKLTDPIDIEFSNLPGGVEVVDPGKQITGDKGTYTLRAGDEADLVKGHMISVTAKGPENLSHTKKLRIEVKQME